MATGALFGNAQSRSNSKHLVEFRAGKMTLKDKMVHPDKRKGMVYVHQSDDSLMHFCWKDRGTNRIEDDLIIFPDDTEFKPVPQCTTGRVFLLKFKASSRRMFFWMQEPKTDKDDEFCKKVNDYLNNPPTPGSSRSTMGIPSELSGESDLQSLLGNMNQQQLMQLLGGYSNLGGLSALMGRPSSSGSESGPPSRVQSSPGHRSRSNNEATTPAPPRPVTAAALPGGGTSGSDSTASAVTAASSVSKSDKPTGGTVQLSDLQTILSGMGGGAAARDPIDLSTAITPESMVPILANKDVQARLIPHLPEGSSLPKNEEELRNTISTPQFQQAMQSFSAALGSGQLGPLMSQFGLGDDVSKAAADGDVEAFVKAMQENEKKNAEKKDEGKEEKMEH